MNLAPGRTSTVSTSNQSNLDTLLSLKVSFCASCVEPLTVKTKAYIPGLDDSAYAAEFSSRPVQRVNSRKASVNYASCVLFTSFFAKIPRLNLGWRVKYAA